MLQDPSENTAFVVAASQKLSAVQKEFNAHFPFLKLEFFRHRHDIHEPSPKRDMILTDHHLKDLRKISSKKMIRITEDMPVATLERLFRETFGISVQVFRKSGRSWLETSITDDWSLKFQNDQGRELSELTR